MKKLHGVSAVIATAFLVFGAAAFASGEKQPGAEASADQKKEHPAADEATITLKVPVTSPLLSSAPLAVVNGEEITMEDLNKALASSHEGMVDDNKKATKIDYAKVLKRLINVRLILQEAKNIGLDELPDTKYLVEAYSRSALRGLFIEDLTKNVRTDEQEADRLYREVVKEWKIKSVMFKKEEDAQAAEKEIKAGKRFDDVVEQAIRNKVAEGGGEGAFLKPKDLQPQITASLVKNAVGSVSTIIKISSGKKDTGFVIFKVEDTRFPDDPAARDKARQAVLDSRKDEAVRNYKRSLYKKLVILHKKFIAGLDYESPKPGLPALLKDKRVVADIKGEKPITVAELSSALQEKFYHGVESAAEAKKVNEKKTEILDGMLEKRLFRREALRQGIDKTEKYKNMVRDYEQSVIFGTFIQKVVVPDVKVTEEEMKTYYREHGSEYTFPEMMRVNGLVFGSMAEAESALAKLRKGADFNWMKANAEGQADKNAQGLLSFEGDIVMAKDFPDDVRKAVAGARAGDFRLYEGPGGYAYVLFIQDVVPPQKQSFDEVRGMVEKKVFGIKLNKAVEDWADKLRAAADIKVYLSDGGM
jgi:hypothetical protein